MGRMDVFYQMRFVDREEEIERDVVDIGVEQSSTVRSQLSDLESHDDSVLSTSSHIPMYSYTREIILEKHPPPGQSPPLRESPVPSDVEQGDSQPPSPIERRVSDGVGTRLELGPGKIPVGLSPTEEISLAEVPSDEERAEEESHTEEAEEEEEEEEITSVRDRIAKYEQIGATGVVAAGVAAAASAAGTATAAAGTAVVGGTALAAGAVVGGAAAAGAAAYAVYQKYAVGSAEERAEHEEDVAQRHEPQPTVHTDVEEEHEGTFEKRWGASRVDAHHEETEYDDSKHFEEPMEYDSATTTHVEEDVQAPTITIEEPSKTSADNVSMGESFDDVETSETRIHETAEGDQSLLPVEIIVTPGTPMPDGERDEFLAEGVVPDTDDQLAQEEAEKTAEQSMPQPSWEREEEEEESPTTERIPSPDESDSDRMERSERHSDSESTDLPMKSDQIEDYTETQPVPSDAMFSTIETVETVTHSSYTYTDERKHVPEDAMAHDMQTDRPEPDLSAYSPTEEFEQARVVEEARDETEEREQAEGSESERSVTPPTPAARTTHIPSSPKEEEITPVTGLGQQSLPTDDETVHSPEFESHTAPIAPETASTASLPRTPPASQSPLSGSEPGSPSFGDKLKGFAKKAGMVAGGAVVAPVALAAMGASAAYDAIQKRRHEGEESPTEAQAPVDYRAFSEERAPEESDRFETEAHHVTTTHSEFERDEDEHIPSDMHFKRHSQEHVDIVETAVSPEPEHREHVIHGRDLDYEEQENIPPEVSYHQQREAEEEEEVEPEEDVEFVTRSRELDHFEVEQAPSDVPYPEGQYEKESEASSPGPSDSAVEAARQHVEAESLSEGESEVEAHRLERTEEIGHEEIETAPHIVPYPRSSITESDTGHEDEQREHDFDAESSKIDLLPSATERRTIEEVEEVEIITRQSGEGSPIEESREEHEEPDEDISITVTTEEVPTRTAEFEADIESESYAMPPHDEHESVDVIITEASEQGSSPTKEEADYEVSSDEEPTPASEALAKDSEIEEVPLESSPIHPPYPGAYTGEKSDEEHEEHDTGVSSFEQQQKVDDQPESGFELEEARISQELERRAEREFELLEQEHRVQTGQAGYFAQMKSAEDVDIPKPEHHRDLAGEDNETYQESDEEGEKSHFGDKLKGFAKKAGMVVGGVIVAPVALAAMGAGAAIDAIQKRRHEGDEDEESPTEELSEFDRAAAEMRPSERAVPDLAEDREEQIERLEHYQRESFDEQPEPAESLTRRYDLEESELEARPADVSYPDTEQVRSPVVSEPAEEAAHEQHIESPRRTSFKTETEDYEEEQIEPAEQLRRLSEIREVELESQPADVPYPYTSEQYGEESDSASERQSHFESEEPAPEPHPRRIVMAEPIVDEPTADVLSIASEEQEESAEPLAKSYELETVELETRPHDIPYPATASSPTASEKEQNLEGEETIQSHARDDEYERAQLAERIEDVSYTDNTDTSSTSYIEQSIRSPVESEHEEMEPSELLTRRVEVETSELETRPHDIPYPAGIEEKTVARDYESEEEGYPAPEDLKRRSEVDQVELESAAASVPYPEFERPSSEADEAAASPSEIQEVDRLDEERYQLRQERDDEEEQYVAIPSPPASPLQRSISGVSEVEIVGVRRSPESPLEQHIHLQRDEEGEDDSENAPYPAGTATLSTGEEVLESPDLQTPRSDDSSEFGAKLKGFAKKAGMVAGGIALAPVALVAVGASAAYDAVQRQRHGSGDEQHPQPSSVTYVEITERERRPAVEDRPPPSYDTLGEHGRPPPYEGGDEEEADEERAAESAHDVQERPQSEARPDDEAEHATDIETERRRSTASIQSRESIPEPDQRADWSSKHDDISEEEESAPHEILPRATDLEEEALQARPQPTAYPDFEREHPVEEEALSDEQAEIELESPATTESKYIVDEALHAAQHSPGEQLPGQLALPVEEVSELATYDTSLEEVRRQAETYDQSSTFSDQDIDDRESTHDAHLLVESAVSTEQPRPYDDSREFHDFDSTKSNYDVEEQFEQPEATVTHDLEHVDEYNVRTEQEPVDVQHWSEQEMYVATQHIESPLEEEISPEIGTEMEKAADTLPLAIESPEYMPTQSEFQGEAVRDTKAEMIRRRSELSELPLEREFDSEELAATPSSTEEVEEIEERAEHRHLSSPEGEEEDDEDLSPTSKGLSFTERLKKTAKSVGKGAAMVAVAPAALVAAGAVAAYSKYKEHSGASPDYEEVDTEEGMEEQTTYQRGYSQLPADEFDEGEQQRREERSEIEIDEITSESDATRGSNASDQLKRLSSHEIALEPEVDYESDLKEKLQQLADTQRPPMDEQYEEEDRRQSAEEDIAPSIASETIMTTQEEDDSAQHYSEAQEEKDQRSPQSLAEEEIPRYVDNVIGNVLESSFTEREHEQPEFIEEEERDDDVETLAPSGKSDGASSTTFFTATDGQGLRSTDDYDTCVTSQEDTFESVTPAHSQDSEYTTASAGDFMSPASRLSQLSSVEAELSEGEGTIVADHSETEQELDKLFGMDPMRYMRTHKASGSVDSQEMTPTGTPTREAAAHAAAAEATAQRTLYESPVQSDRLFTSQQDYDEETRGEQFYDRPPQDVGTEELEVVPEVSESSKAPTPDKGRSPSEEGLPELAHDTAPTFEIEHVEETAEDEWKEGADDELNFGGRGRSGERLKTTASGVLLNPDADPDRPISPIPPGMIEEQDGSILVSSVDKFRGMSVESESSPTPPVPFESEERPMRFEADFEVSPETETRSTEPLAESELTPSSAEIEIGRQDSIQELPEDEPASGADTLMASEITVVPGEQDESHADSPDHIADIGARVISPYEAVSSREMLERSSEFISDTDDGDLHVAVSSSTEAESDEQHIAMPPAVGYQQRQDREDTTAEHVESHIEREEHSALMPQVEEYPVERHTTTTTITETTIVDERNVHLPPDVHPDVQSEEEQEEIEESYEEIGGSEESRAKSMAKKIALGTAAAVGAVVVGPAVLAAYGASAAGTAIAGAASGSSLGAAAAAMSGAAAAAYYKYTGGEEKDKLETETDGSEDIHDKAMEVEDKSYIRQLSDVSQSSDSQAPSSQPDTVRYVGEEDRADQEDLIRQSQESLTARSVESLAASSSEHELQHSASTESMGKHSHKSPKKSDSSDSLDRASIKSGGSGKRYSTSRRSSTSSRKSSHDEPQTFTERLTPELKVTWSPSEKKSPPTSEQHSPSRDDLSLAKDSLEAHADAQSQIERSPQSPENKLDFAESSLQLDEQAELEEGQKSPSDFDATYPEELVPEELPMESELETVEEEPEAEETESQHGSGSGSSSTGAVGGAFGETIALIAQYKKSAKAISSDNVSESSLQEFERIEHDILAKGESSLSSSEMELFLASGRRRPSDGSTNSLAEFERLEMEVTEGGTQLSPGQSSEHMLGVGGNGNGADVMILSDIREESEAEDMSTRDDDEEAEDLHLSSYVLGADLTSSEFQSIPVSSRDVEEERMPTPTGSPGADDRSDYYRSTKVVSVEVDDSGIETAPVRQEALSGATVSEQRADASDADSIDSFEHVEASHAQPGDDQRPSAKELDVAGADLLQTSTDSLDIAQSDRMQTELTVPHGADDRDSLEGDVAGAVAQPDHDRDSLQDYEVVERPIVDTERSTVELVEEPFTHDSLEDVREQHAQSAAAAALQLSATSDMTDKDSVLEGGASSQEMAASSQDTHGMLSCDTTGTYQEYGRGDDHDRDSLTGDIEEVLHSGGRQPHRGAEAQTPVAEMPPSTFPGHTGLYESGSQSRLEQVSYPCTLTTYETSQIADDGTVEVITRSVTTRVTDPVMSHVHFTGTESEERVRQYIENIHGSGGDLDEFESVDNQGNVTKTVVRRLTGQQQTGQPVQSLSMTQSTTAQSVTVVKHPDGAQPYHHSQAFSHSSDDISPGDVMSSSSASGGGEPTFARQAGPTGGHLSAIESESPTGSTDSLERRAP
uniref:Uncharacterized protein n=3 Tax=Plectus sambesii TaxID=2011161 RepID=A0A914WLL7_9BILA